MPARVHAILVVRPEGRTPAAHHLKRTLAAISAQSRPVDALTIVLCGADPELTQLAASSGAEGVITASAGTPFAVATALATPRLTGDAVWLLAQDTAPESDALVRLAGALELSPSLAVAAPKLVRWDEPDEIVSLGISLTRYGRTVELAAGEFDQGQHDGDADVLGADVRGLLIRRESWTALGGLDPALGGADEGVDLGVRARLAGDRVSLVPAARVAVAGDGVAAMARGRRRARRRAFAERTAQLHRRLVYAPAAAVPLHWLSFLPLALWRTILHLIGKVPYRVLPEWGATILVMARIAAVARARRRIRAVRSVGWSRIAPLRVSRSEMRLRWEAADGGVTDAPVRPELRFFVGGGAWAVLGALAVSAALFFPLLAWPVLGGGALAPLRATVVQLWQDAAWGERPLGLDAIGPADPFSAIIAVIGTLSPGDPSRALVVLWVLALPLAVLGGWFAATRVTESSLLRITAAVAWALAPTFLAAIVEGRPAALIAHLLLPWLFYAASVAHRAWAPAGAASVLLVLVLACAPSFAPAVVVLWSAALVVVALVAGRGVARVVWLVVPSIVVFAPLVWTQVRTGNPWGLLADPGIPYAGNEVSADPVGRALLAAGFPSSDPGGWASVIDGPVWWVGLLIAPLAVLALLAVLTPRWVTASALLIIAAVGLATAFAAVGVAVSFDHGTAVPLWPGAGLSLAWLGVVGSAMVALDAGIVERVRVLRPIGALVTLAALLVAVSPALTASLDQSHPRSVLTNGPTSTLPAFVAAEGRGSTAIGTIVLDPRADGLRVDVVWGGSATVGGQSTVRATRIEAQPADRELAALAADLTTPSSDDVIERLGERGIGFVLLQSASAGENDVIRGARLAAATSLDQRDALDGVGTTSRGDLWRVTASVQPRPPLDDHQARVQSLVTFGSLGVLLVALLLAVPTSASRRVARRTPRIVGPNPGGSR
ncbi:MULTISPECIES: glycosyltransferase [Microbacterium]|uniref:glycosyltransferase n=1 Tax=Microbacterium TaxID=33882 RepID=UPI002788CE13|nr:MULTISPECIES: glycosyltransferase [Microbacterium]MDQ1073980.1 GT2 family glycosyltransferase [Microbacterium sp. SORGH_AS_0969]MDQ1114208.1 GT2 family glycosyltransferase [Microbacterium testaceum]